jgi:hypothetical protein
MMADEEGENATAGDQTPLGTITCTCPCGDHVRRLEALQESIIDSLGEQKKVMLGLIRLLDVSEQFRSELKDLEEMICQQAVTKQTRRH